MPVKRKRQKFKFWLNISNSKDKVLAEKMDALKTQSLLTPYIRRGVVLYKSLKEDADLQILFEMFPWIREIISPQTDAIAMLQKQMALLEKALLESDENFDTEVLLQVVTDNDRKEGSGVDTFLNSFMEINQ